MSKLHLTDKQMTELAAMSLSGKIEADALRLWRKAYSREPWAIEDSIEEIAEALVTCRGAHDHIGPPPEIEWRDDDEGRAIINDHNTAELRAAAVYWTEKKHLCREAYSHQLEQGLSVGDEWPGWGNLAAANIELSAIERAYAEIKQ